MRTILITGGAGFIGSNFIPYFLQKYPKYSVINLDALTYAGNLDNLREIENHPRYKFIQGNICDKELVENLFDKYHINGVIHFAAESHVDNSINNPSVFIETNINGTHTILDIAYRFWMDGPFKNKPMYQNARFHHISTDEVYGSLPEDSQELFTESTPYAPRSPYSASKAASDMIVKSYYYTYGMNIVVTNCSNNYGPKQHDEKLIPTIIRNALEQKPIPIYGDGQNIRDWLYVYDHCRAIDLVFHKGKSGEVYNIGARNEQKNITIAKKICSILDRIIPRQNNKNYEDLITFVQDRPGHDRRYALDPSKIEIEVGWKPFVHFEQGLEKTVQWYINKYKG